MSYTMICTIFCVLGIYLAKYTALSGVIIFTIVGILCGVLRKRKNIALVIALCSFLSGSVLYNSASYNKVYESFPDKYVTMVGTVTSPAMVSSGEYKYKYLLKPDEVSYLGQTLKIDKPIYIKTKESYKYGDMLRFSGFLTEITGGDNQYDFDYSESLKSKGIYNKISAYEIEKTGVIDFRKPKYWMSNFRNLIFDAINTRFSGDTAAIYTAMILGDRSYISNEFTTRLLRTGVWQAIYSPYIHIAILTMIAGLFCNGFRKNRALFVLLLIYAMFNVGNVNALKASLLILAMILCRWIFGYTNKKQQLSALVLAMIIINPMLCYSRGFVVSVVSTILIIIFYPAVSGMVWRMFPKRKKWMGKIVSVISVFIIFTICAYPLSSYLFNGISLYSTLITTMLIPVVAMIYAASVVYLPMVIFAGGCYQLERVVAYLLRFVCQLPDAVEKIPFHYIPSKTPSLLWLITAYLILWLIAQLISNRKRDDIFKAVSAVALSFAFVCVFFSQSPGLEIYFVNVGQGDAAVLHTSDNETVLIDGGGAAEYFESDYNVGDMVLVPYLISHGFADIDYAVVSHFHKDHAEGVVSAVKNLRVKNIVMPDSAHDNEYRQELERLAEEKKINIIYAEEGGMISLKSGLRLNFLAPDDEQRISEDANDTSIVMAVEYFDFVGLFTADSTDVVDSDYPRYVDVLKVAHHGSDTGSSKADVEYICPKYAVISVGKGNSYGLPDDLVIDNLEGVNAHILRTDMLGDIRFRIRKNGKIFI